MFFKAESGSYVRGKVQRQVAAPVSQNGQTFVFENFVNPTHRILSRAVSVYVDKYRNIGFLQCVLDVVCIFEISQRAQCQRSFGCVHKAAKSVGVACFYPEKQSVYFRVQCLAFHSCPFACRFIVKFLSAFILYSFLRRLSIKGCESGEICVLGHLGNRFLFKYDIFYKYACIGRKNLLSYQS